MKKIILSLVIILGFIITASAQSTTTRTVRPNERRMERRMERRRVRRRMERRHHRRHHRIVGEINATSTQRSQAVLFRSEATSNI